MNWLNIEIRMLHGPEYIGADPVERATWLNLLAYCCEQENGGIMFGAAAWKDRQWQQTCGVLGKEIRASTLLWKRAGDDIEVWGYPHEKVEIVKMRREMARKGGEASGKNRGAKKSPAQALLQREVQAEREALGEAFASANGEAIDEASAGVLLERNEKENEKGIGREGFASSASDRISEESAENLPPSHLQKIEKKSPAAKKNAAELCLAEQAVRFGALFERKPGAMWSGSEMSALSAAQPITEGEMRLIEWRYRQPEEERDPRRTRLRTLLENLPGEIDAARAQLKRHSSDATSGGAPRQEPQGWREILEKKYRRPEDTEWTAPASFYDLPDSVQAEILEEIKQQKTCEK